MRGRRRNAGEYPIAQPRVARPIPPLLIEANRLAAEGNYGQAAGIYERMADTALDRQLPRAPYLYLQAGRAYYFAQRNTTGAALIRRGLSLFAEQGRWLELRRSGARILFTLTNQGFAEDAAEFQAWLEVSFPKLGDSDTPEGEGVHESFRASGHLPAQCPFCGAPVDPQEVEWVSESNGECIYCGNLLRGEFD